MADASDVHTTPILIVDDCSDTASTLSELLTLKGYKNVLWSSGYGMILALCRMKDYGFLLLDMHMPRMNGLDVM